MGYFLKKSSNVLLSHSLKAFLLVIIFVSYFYPQAGFAPGTSVNIVSTLDCSATAIA